MIYEVAGGCDIDIMVSKCKILSIIKDWVFH